METEEMDKNRVMGMEICVLEIRSRTGLEKRVAEPKLSGRSNLPIFFMITSGLGRFQKLFCTTAFNYSAKIRVYFF
jgi:hypothetical protein